MFKSTARKVAAVATLGASLLLGLAASAEDYGLIGRPTVPSTVTPVAPTTPPGGFAARPVIAAPAAVQLTPEQLSVMLANMGYEVEAKVNDKGQSYNSLKISRNGWTYNPTVALSPDRTMLWISSPCADYPANAASIPAEKMVALLQKNAEFGPGYFNYKPAFGKIYYSVPSANVNLTAKDLRAKLEQFCDDIRNTEELWSPAKWAAAAPAAVSTSR